MIIRTHRSFDKKYARLPEKIQNQFTRRRDLFVIQPFHPLLNNHSVEHVYPDCRSINVTGDYRAIFAQKGDVVVFVNVGTHSELYS